MSVEETLETLREIDSVRLKGAYADIERVRMGGYDVFLKRWGKKVESGVKRSDPNKKGEKGIYNLYVDSTTPGHWDEAYVMRVLRKEAETEKQGFKVPSYRPPVIRLNDREVMEAEIVAKLRQETAEELHLDGRYLNEDPHLLGCMGEQVARHYLGLSMRLPNRDAKDHGFDLVWMGQRIDVKATATKMPRPAILLGYDDLYKPGVCDVYVGVQVEGRGGKSYGGCWERPGVHLPQLAPGTSGIPFEDLNSMEGFGDAMRNGREGDSGQSGAGRGDGGDSPGAVCRSQEGIAPGLFD